MQALVRFQYKENFFEKVSSQNYLDIIRLNIKIYSAKCKRETEKRIKNLPFFVVVVFQTNHSIFNIPTPSLSNCHCQRVYS